MIGVWVRSGDRAVVREFFQLFKTPWEFWRPGGKYDLVIASGDEMPDAFAQPTVLYDSRPSPSDDALGVSIESQTNSGWVEWHGSGIPIYGRLATLCTTGEPVLRCRETGNAVAATVGPLKRAVRIGYDLFSEVSLLLTAGQPAQNASIPTLDLHTSLLRSLLVKLRISFVEILPAPHGYDFMVCLTHDVDFVGLRDHRFDHTMWGFLYRCFVGSLKNALVGRTPWQKCRRNWMAGLSLPFVFMGLRKDFWLEFERYMKIEKGLGSTFFFIPFRGTAGTLGPAPAPKRRAAKYDFLQIRNHVLGLLEGGCEIALHGIDAWHDSTKGRNELARIQELTRQTEVGTRMHWLYWMEDSPKVLEEAGFAYDSTFGYNEAVGFRAGTTQAFQPLKSERLIELPLNIQDSALFYPDRMNLSETDALAACKSVIESAVSAGGALTVNWHTRSLSPERFWGGFYLELLNELRAHRVWFGTAQRIVQWFRERRALEFDTVSVEGACVNITFNGGPARFHASVTVRVHHAQSTPEEDRSVYTDVEWNGGETLVVSCPELTV